MAARLAAIEGIVVEIQPCSVRQVFYQAVVRGLVEKTELAYEKVQRALVGCGAKGEYALRLDRRRHPLDPEADDLHSLEVGAPAHRPHLPQGVMGRLARLRRGLDGEGRAAGVVLRSSTPFDVPLMVARGFASLSFLASAAEYMDGLDKQVFVYQLGDHDPSGVAAAATIESTLRELAPSADITFERLAVTPAQIGDFAAAPPDQAHRFPRRQIRSRVRRGFGRA